MRPAGRDFDTYGNPAGQAALVEYLTGRTIITADCSGSRITLTLDNDESVEFEADMAYGDPNIEVSAQIAAGGAATREGAEPTPARRTTPPAALADIRLAEELDARITSLWTTR